MMPEEPFEQNQFIPNLHEKSKQHRRQHLKQTTSSHHIVPPTQKHSFSPTQPSTSQLNQQQQQLHPDYGGEEKIISKGLVLR